MAYQVGSLADLISGTQDAVSSNKKVVYIPAKRKNIVKTAEKQQNIHVISSDKKRLPEASASQHERKKIKLESFAASANLAEDQEEHKFSSKLTRPKKRAPLDKEKEVRTIFVKNVPYSANSKDLKRKFEKYGKVECLRFRCAPREDSRISKKISVIKKEFHPDRTNISAFVRFCDPGSVEKALEANGTIYEGYRIFVDKALKEQKHDQKKAIFLGNLPFDVEENDIWNIFEQCGKISDIRIVRDKFTALGKGFAFVNFENADAVELALSLQGVKLKEKEIRVFRATKSPNCRQKNRINHNIHRKGDQESNRGNDRGYKNKQRRDKIVQNKLMRKENQNKTINNKQSSIESTRKRKDVKNQYRGQKATEKKKKKKINKNDLKKKIIAKMLTSSVGKGKTVLK